MMIVKDAVPVKGAESRNSSMVGDLSPVDWLDPDATASQPAPRRRIFAAALKSFAVCVLHPMRLTSAGPSLTS